MTNFVPSWTPIEDDITETKDEVIEEPEIDKLVDVDEKIESIISDRTNDNTRDKALEMLTPESRNKALKVAADHNLKSDDPVWVLIAAMASTVDAVNTLKSVENDLVKHVAEAAAAELIQAKVESAKIQAESEAAFERYSNDAKKYMEKLLAGSLKNALQQTVNVINRNVDKVEAKMTNAMSESLIDVARDVAMKSAKIKHDIHRPYRWMALAMLSAFLICGGSYYIGMTSYKYDNAYKVAQSYKSKWADFVTHYQKATPDEKAVINKVMERNT